MKIKATGKPDVDAAKVAIETSFHKEHNVDDDTHSTIHATGKIYERERIVAIGDTLPVNFMPTLFTGSGAMTWVLVVGCVVNFSYCLIGSRMFIDFDFVNTIVGGTPDLAVQFKIPDGWFAARQTMVPCRIVDQAVITSGLAVVAAMGRNVLIYRQDIVNWAAGGAANNDVQGQISFEVRTA